jgi:hypothetical protein
MHDLLLNILFMRGTVFSVDACNSPDSGPNSPPTASVASMALHSGRGNTPIQEVSQKRHERIAII